MNSLVWPWGVWHRFQQASNEATHDDFDIREYAASACNPQVYADLHGLALAEVPLF
jgi:hypothetical protein